MKKSLLVLVASLGLALISGQSAFAAHAHRHGHKVCKMHHKMHKMHKMHHKMHKMHKNHG
jgi:hypothetical protein